MTPKDMYQKITSEDVEEFREAYNKCEGTVFDWKGNEVLKHYAKYVLEYFDGIPRLTKTHCAPVPVTMKRN